MSFLLSLASFLLLGILCWELLRGMERRKKRYAFAKANNCESARWTLPYRYPLALDVVWAGFDASRKQKLLSFFAEYFNRLGPTIEVCLLGGKGLVTMDPENIEAILSTQFNDFHMGPRSKGMKAMIGEGIIAQDSAKWKRSRTILRHRFGLMQHNLLHGFREHVDRLISEIDQKQGRLDSQPLFNRFTLDTTISMLLGQPVESLGGRTRVEFTGAFDYASLVTATRVRLGDLYFLYTPSGFRGACQTVKDLTQKFVQNARSTNKVGQKVQSGDSFLEELYRTYGSDDLVRDQIINLLIGGRDTTASTLSYTFRLLVSHPAAMAKLRKEVDDTLGSDQEITRAKIQRMPYLQNVIKETLRLFPPVPINTRFCRQMTTLPRGGGTDGNSPLLVLEGMPVAYSVYHMQRRTDIYGPDALSFRPERWEGVELADVKWAYLPFNGGPRVCLGKDFGPMLASYTTARLIQAFSKIELPPGVELEPIGEEKQHLTLTMSNADGCKVVIER